MIGAGKTRTLRGTLTKGSKPSTPARSTSLPTSDHGLYIFRYTGS